VSTILQNKYNINPTVPKDIARISLSDRGLYKVITKDSFGRYLLVTYTGTIDSSRQIQAINVSPAFEKVSELYRFLKTTEDINFDMEQTETTIPTAENLGLIINMQGQTFSQLCKENGMYTIAYYMVDLESNQRKFIDFDRVITYPSTGLTIFMTKVNEKFGINSYPTPTTWYSIDDLSIIRPYDNVSLTLLGDNPMSMEVNTAFKDPGYTAQNVSDVNSADDLNPAVVGTYTVTYTAKDKDGRDAKSENRIVNVVDTTPPLITLSGGTELTHEVKTVFVSPKYTVTDNYSSLANIIITTGGTVNTNILGKNTLSYTARDAAGNTTTLTQTINVVDTTAPSITLE
jgi:hypothetical protein